LELSGRQVLKVDAGNGMQRAVTGFDLDGGLFDPGHEPNSTRGGRDNSLASNFIIASGLGVAI
jgi:hypothetical protein